MLLAVAALLMIGAVIFTFFVRHKDLPEPEAVSPVAHLEDRKARIYEGLRDLTFEHRVGKLSEEDYQRTKAELQAELARVIAEIEAVLASRPATRAPARPAAAVAPSGPSTSTCTHCGAVFDRPMKFCGECGQPIKGAES